MLARPHHRLVGSQQVLDRLPKTGATDLRKNRSILNNIILTTTGAAKALARVIPVMERIGFIAESVRIPTSTGSATAIAEIFPELKGRLNGHAVRVPLTNASLTDCVFEVERATTVEEVNRLLQAAAEGALKGVLGYETRPLVSIDFQTDPRSSIIDALSTMVVNGTQVKIYAWYDNEWGYANRTVELAKMVGMAR